MYETEVNGILNNCTVVAGISAEVPVNTDDRVKT